MANDLSSLLKYDILPNAIAVLRENTIMARMIWNDFQPSVIQQNEKVKITIPADLGDALDVNFTTANTPKNITPTTVELGPAQWKEQPLSISDKEIQDSVIKGHLPAVIDSAVKGIANTIDKAILTLGKEIYQFSGVAGTTPQTVEAYTNLRQKMNDALIPDQMGMRKLVFDTAAENEYNQLFYNAQTVGQTQTLEDGALVRKFNMDIAMDQNVRSHVNGASTTATIGTCLAGASVCNITGASLSDTITKGTLFTVAGVAQQFVVTADTATDGGGAAAALPFSPPAPETLSGKVITFIASHVMNLAFAKKAFAIAWIPVSNNVLFNNQNSVTESYVDPVSGIPMTIEMWREPGTAQNRMAIRTAYSVGVGDAKLAVRFLG